MAVMDILTVKVKNSYDSSYIRDAKVAIDIVSPSGANPSHLESYTTSQGAPFRFQANSGPSLINITATYEGVTANAKNQSIKWSYDVIDQGARTATLEVMLYYKPTTTTEDLTITITTPLVMAELEKPQYIKLYYYKNDDTKTLKTIYTITETLPYVAGVTATTIKRPWDNKTQVTIMAVSETRSKVDSKQYLLRGTVTWTALLIDPTSISITLSSNEPQINTVILVKDQFGFMIPGAVSVSLIPLWSDDPVVTGTTDGKGLFTTNSDRPFKSVTVSKDGYFSTTENLDLNVLSQREVVLLKKSYTVYGKCYKKNGLGTSAAEITINYKNGTSSKVTPNNSGDWTYTANNEIKNIACNVGYYNSAIYNYDDNSIKRFDFITDLTGDLDGNQIATKEHYAVLKDRNIHNDTSCQDWQCPTVADILTVTKLLISGDKTENRCPKYSEARESYVTLTPSTTPLILNRNGLSPATVALTSNDSWTLDYSYKNKFTVTPTQGTGNATITIRPTGANYESNEIVDNLTVTTSNNKQNHISFSQRKFETIILASSGSTGFTIPQSFVGKELYLSASETTMPTTNYLLGKITEINDQQVLVSTQNVTFDQVTNTSNALNSGELKEKNKIYIGVIDGTFTPLLAAIGTNIGSEGFTFVSQALAHVSTQSWNGYAQSPMSCEQVYSGPSTATWRIPFDWETNINTAYSDTSIPLRISPYPTYNESNTNGKYIDLLCEYHTGANAGLDIITNSSAITELKQKLAGDWKYFDYLYFWTNDGIVTNNVVKKLDGTKTIKRYGRFMLFEIEMAAYKFDEGLNKLIAGQDFDMTDENNMNTDDAGSYITDGTKSMLYTNYIYFTGMLPVCNQTNGLIPVGFGVSLTDGTTQTLFNITSIGGNSTEGWVYDDQYARSMIHINRAIGLKNEVANTLDGFLVYVSTAAGEANSATTAKDIILRASGSDSPVTDMIYEGDSTGFTVDSEGRFFPFAPFVINSNLMDLIHGEMTTVEISASGSGNYAIIVS